MKIVEILSGGLDSTTLLYFLKHEGHDVSCLSINYGQRHLKELEFAARACMRLDVEHCTADLSSLNQFLKGSSQTDLSVDVPEGHYEAESMKLTVVPNRNFVMLGIAAMWAFSIKADAIAYAAHSGDHAIYPDCREEFVQAIEKAIGLADWHQVKLLRPFITKSKAEIVAAGAGLGVPFENTWSCYKGGEVHCGRCGTCYERRLAFEAAKVADPTVYLDSTTRF